jgi:flagellar hook-associated protein 1 FlgK
VSNLLSSLMTSASSLNTFDQVLQVTQNNVANASTPGFVKQRQSLLAMPFDPSMGMGGGVRAGEVESSRNEYADQAVRRQNTLLGQTQQDVNSLTSIQSLFDISGDSGIPQGLNALFQSFSAWGQSPNDTIARQNVIARASDLAGDFRQLATGLANAADDAEHQVGQTVDTINNLVSKLRGYNKQILSGARNDAAVDAGLHATLEDLSQNADISILNQADGTVTVLMNGQTPLLLGDRQYKISTKLETPDTPPPVYTQARPSIHILASDGADVTAATTGGQLGSLLNFRNGTLASYLGDATQPGDLNRMAKQLADRVNGILTAGNVSDGPPPEPGVALFSYDTANDTNVAATLTVDQTSVTPDGLGPIDPGPPYVSNGVPLALSQMADPQHDADRIDGASYNQFFGDLAARTGSALNQANSNLQVAQPAVAQARNLQQQMSGVSLDEEASVLIQFQRAYEASSRLITVMYQLTEDTINMLQP